MNILNERLVGVGGGGAGRGGGSIFFGQKNGNEKQFFSQKKTFCIVASTYLRGFRPKFPFLSGRDEDF